MIKRVYSDNADFQKLEVLKTNRNKRHRYGQFIVEGVRNINEAVRCGWEISSFIYAGGGELSSWARGMLNGVKTDVDMELAPRLMAELSGKDDTSELMALVRMRPDDTSRLELGGAPFIALFDRPSNRGNLGTVIRSCDAFGMGGLIVTGHGVDPYDPEVVGASMGSFFSVPVVYLPENRQVAGFLDDMRARFDGFSAVGTSAHAQVSLKDAALRPPLVVMIGNETDGLSASMREMCDVMVSIPMAATSSASSFNVGCAASILFYEVARSLA